MIRFARCLFIVPLQGRGIGEKIGKVKIPLYFYARKDGRVVDCGGLENR